MIIREPNVKIHSPSSLLTRGRSRPSASSSSTPNVTSMPCEVASPGFLHVMTLAGILAEKLYGCVWQFKPTQLDVERGIQFHEPHPPGRLLFTVARQHRQKLNQAYGRFGGMFVTSPRIVKVRSL